MQFNENRKMTLTYKLITQSKLMLLGIAIALIVGCLVNVLSLAIYTKRFGKMGTMEMPDYR